MKELTHSGKILGDRYRILKQLRRGDRKSYLAEDITHLNELLVLKELPSKTEFLERGEDSSKLNHPQIPRFRELLRTEDEGKERWFSVEDYTRGTTYRYLLQNRLQKGRQGFSELEVTALLLQVLPILEYIHAKSITHGHISPDNIVLRSEDALPVLVFEDEPKSTAATTTSLASSPSEPNLPHDDLYALAATSLVLLTGKERHPPLADWDWQREIVLSPPLTKILQKMLSQKPKKRFGSATKVIQALRQAVPSANPLTQPPLAKAPATPLSAPKGGAGCIGKAVLLIAVIIVPGVGGWFAGKAWLEQQTPTIEEAASLPQSKPVLPPEPLFEQQALRRLQQKQEALERRRRTLGIDEDYFSELIEWEWATESFSQQRGTLAQKQRWNDIAAEYLDKLNFLSAEALQGLGSYDRTTSDRLTRAANQLHLSSRALYDLVDAEFFSRFPDREPPLEDPLAQIWSAIAFDKLNELRSGEALEQIEPNLTSTQLRGTLAPGEGQAYTVYLDAEQVMDASLLAEQNALLSIYSPSGRVEMLEDSTARQWSGILPESGYYEFTIVSQSKQPLTYRLTLSVESQVKPESLF